MKIIKKTIQNLLLQKTKNKNVKNCYITCSGRNDGLGAQIHSILTVMLIAKQYDVKYIHTPIEILDHTEGKEKFFEEFFSLEKNELNINSLNRSELKIVNIKHPYNLRPKENTLYVTQGLHKYLDKYPDSFLEIKKDIKDKFHTNDKSKYDSHIQKNKLNIALHVRRGDVSESKNSVRFTGNDFYKQILEKILKISSNFNIEININLYSQGSLDDFKDLDEFEINYHLNECLATTFINLINSDILVMSKSSLSYCAALYSDNIILYQKFWHEPMSSWNIIEVNNESIKFNENKLKEDLVELIKCKELNAI